MYTSIVILNEQLDRDIVLIHEPIEENMEPAAMDRCLIFSLNKNIS